MFIERIKEKFTTDDPIFTKEILDLFPDYSRAQVFRFIKKAVEDKELIFFTRGVYAIPSDTIFGMLIGTSTDDIVFKRYINRDGNVFGVISGMKLLNIFHITTQMPAVWDIVTNNESTRSREIIIDRRKFVLHKSRVTINDDNYATYTVLQLFTDLADDDIIDDYSKESLFRYIKRHNVTKEQVISMMEYFPSKTVKRVIRSKVLDEIA